MSHSKSKTLLCHYHVFTLRHFSQHTERVRSSGDAALYISTLQTTLGLLYPWNWWRECLARTHVVDVDPDVNIGLLESITKLKNCRFWVPLVTDEDVTTTWMWTTVFSNISNKTSVNPSIHRSINQSINPSYQIGQILTRWCFSHL